MAINYMFGLKKVFCQLIELIDKHTMPAHLLKLLIRVSWMKKS